MELKDLVAVQAASALALPCWFPFFNRHLTLKAAAGLSESSAPSGMRKYYAGFGRAVMIQPLYPLTVWTQNTVQSWLRAHGWFNGYTNAAASFVIGGMTSLVANPLDVAILAKQRGDSLSQIIRREGILVLFKGGLAFSFRNGSFFTGLTVLSPKLTQIFQEMFGLSIETASMLGAGTSSIIFTTAVVPVDVASVMRQSLIYRNLSTFACLRRVIITRGLWGLTAGFGHRCLATTIELFLFQNFVRLISAHL